MGYTYRSGQCYGSYVMNGGYGMNSGFFNYDGPFFTVLNRISDLIILNLLWIVCSIPIVTIGASTTALLYVTMKILRGEDAYIAKNFFKSFKENFLQSTIIWLIMLAVGAILLGNYLFLPNMNLPNFLYTMFFSASCFTALLYSMLLMYLFPLQARLENKIKHTFKNALLLSFRHLPTTIVLILLVYVTIYLSWWHFAKLFYIVILFAVSGIAMVCSILYNRMFDIYLKPVENSDEMEEIEESEADEYRAKEE